MLQYVMTKLETHNINSDGQIIHNRMEQVRHINVFNLELQNMSITLESNFVFECFEKCITLR